MTRYVDKLAVWTINVGPHLLEEVLSHDTARVLCRVVGQQLVCEHVSSEGECNTSVGRGVVVGVGRDGVLLAVVLVLSEHPRGDQAISLLVGEVEQLLQEDWVRRAIAVHAIYSQIIATSDRSITLGLQMSSTSADTAGRAKKVSENTKGVQVRVARSADSPLSRDWITIEEHGGGLEEDSGSLVKAESLPKTSVDGLCGHDS